MINSIKHVNNNIFKNIITYTVDKAGKATFDVSRKCKSAGYIAPTIGTYLFDVYILPVLNYGCNIWGSLSEPHCIETVHLKYHKYMLGVNPCTCNLAILGKFGRFPILVHQHIKMFKYWICLIHLANDKLVKRPSTT